MSAAPRIVFDTNTLWNFAIVHRLDLLETRYGDRCTWTETVADEVDTASAWVSELGMLKSCDWLGDPVAPGRSACLSEVANLQRILASPEDGPTKHLGEAESIHVIEHELDGLAWLVSDDNGALDLAARRGIRVLRTHDVLAECHAMGELGCPQPFTLLVQMADADRRGVRVPTDHTAIC